MQQRTIATDVILTATSRTRLHPTSEEEIRLVRDELESILANPHFASSKRYPAFLSFVVVKALEGDAGQLKERTLGIEVFQRRPDYDTNSDTIVRFVASEVRKRLSLVYQESAVHRVQIVLSAGSYTPEFFLLEPEETQPEVAETQLDIAPHEIPEPAMSAPAKPLRTWSGWWLAALGMICLLVFFVTNQRSRPTALARFWQPMVSSSSSVLISPGALVFSPTLKVTRADKTVEYPYVSLATASSLADIVAMLSRSKKPYIVEASSALTLTEIRGRPVIFLGGYNNDWTPRALDELRFRFTPQASDLKIYDSANSRVSWMRPPVPYSEADDFAIIARFHAKLTEAPMVVLAGIGKNGTEAASQFVTDPRYLGSLEQSLPKGWDTKNIEFVIRTQVIDGKTGEPTLEAVHIW